MKKYKEEKSVRVQFYLNTEKEGERAIYEYIKEVMEESYIPESAAVKSIIRKAISGDNSNSNNAEETIKEISNHLTVNKTLQEIEEIEEEFEVEEIHTDVDDEEFEEDDIKDMLSGI